jgi:GTP-binding protein SAR1
MPRRPRRFFLSPSTKQQAEKMSLVNWFWDVLVELGLMNKSAKLIFLGLDNAGKTELIHMMKYDRLGNYPTRRPRNGELTIGSIDFKIVDMPGERQGYRVFDI